jgi:hypothetical protein
VGLTCARVALAATSALAAIATALAQRRNEKLREPIFNGFPRASAMAVDPL